MTDTGSYEALMGGRDLNHPGPEEGRGSNRRPYEELDDNELVKRMDQWFNRVTETRKHVERASLLATAFLMDQQYVDFAGTQQGAKLVQQPHKKGRVRTVEQIIEPIYRGELSRLTRNKPTGVVVPSGQDEEDYEAAQAAEHILDYVYQTYNQDTFIEETASWAITGGTAAYGVTWDPTEIDPDGQAGAFVFRALSPFEFGVPDVRRTRIQDQPYFMVTKAYDLDEIEDRWEVRVRPDAQGSYGNLDDRLSSIISGGSTSGRQSAPERAIVKETWIKPQPLAPTGLVVVTAGGRVLEKMPWPQWTSAQYPFAEVKFIPIPGSFWGKGLIQALIPLQRRHNRAASIVIEVQNMLAQMGLAAPRGTNVRQILGGRGTLMELPPGATQPVSNLSPPPIGDLPFRELENTRQAARDISYQHEVSKGYTPPNVRSGTAISLLKEVDDSASAVPLRHIERAVEIIGNHVIRIVRQEWDEARQIKVLGQDGELERISLIGGEDVGGQYIVQAGSAWPFTKAEKQGFVSNLLQLQLVSPDEALKHLDMGSTSSQIRREREVDMRHARRENQRFEEIQLTIDPQTGGLAFSAPPPVPEDWHNHLAHVEIHRRLQKSPRYERWPEHKKVMLEAHITGHMAALYAQMAQNPGMLGGEGAAPPPPTMPPMPDEGAEPEGETSRGEE